MFSLWFFDFFCVFCYYVNWVIRAMREKEIVRFLAGHFFLFLYLVISDNVFFGFMRGLTSRKQHPAAPIAESASTLRAIGEKAKFRRNQFL